MQLTQDHLQRAFQRLAFKCVSSLEEAMADERRAKLVTACARSIAFHDQRQARAAERRRVIRPADNSPSPSRTWWKPPAAGHAADLKRKAANDND